MKIAILHQSLGLINRGSEISVQIIATELAKKHKVLVLQSGPVTKGLYPAKRVMPQTIAPPAAPRNIVEKILYRLAWDQRSRIVKEFSSACLPHLTKFMPDITVVTNGADQLKIIQKALPDTKTVVFGRAGIGHDDLSNLAHSPNLFVALTQSGADWAVQSCKPATKVVYIPNPLKLTKAKKIDLNLPKPVILTVGSLTQYKNIPAVIRAVAHYSASFLLIGDGEDSDHISAALSSYPGEFRWLKEVAPAELPAYYHASDIFCFVPDPQEAFGRVYLEAMSAGLPIVASDDPIRREIIGDQGIYVDPKSDHSIQEGLNLAYHKGKLNYKQELKKYQPATVVKNIEKEFYDLIKQ